MAYLFHFYWQFLWSPVEEPPPSPEPPEPPEEPSAAAERLRRLRERVRAREARAEEP